MDGRKQLESVTKNATNIDQEINVSKMEAYAISPDTNLV